MRWRPPSDSDVQSYRVRWKSDDVNAYMPELRVAATMVSIPNLPSGQYDVQVAALEVGVDAAITSATVGQCLGERDF